MKSMLPRKSPSSGLSRTPCLVAEEFLERSLRQRHEEPNLKTKEQGQRHGDAQDGDRVPREAADPAHEGTDEECAGDIDPEENNRSDDDSRRRKPLERSEERRE